MKLKANAEASAYLVKAESEAKGIEQVGKARAEAYRAAAAAMGQDNFSAMEIMRSLSDNHVKITPDILVNGGGSGDSSGTSGLVSAVLAKTMLGASTTAKDVTNSATTDKKTA